MFLLRIIYLRQDIIISEIFIYLYVLSSCMHVYRYIAHKYNFEKGAYYNTMYILFSLNLIIYRILTISFHLFKYYEMALYFDQFKYLYE